MKENNIKMAKQTLELWKDFFYIVCPQCFKCEDKICIKCRKRRVEAMNEIIKERYGVRFWDSLKLKQKRDFMKYLEESVIDNIILRN